MAFCFRKIYFDVWEWCFVNQTLVCKSCDRSLGPFMKQWNVPQCRFWSSNVFCSTHVSHYLQSAEIAIQVEMSTVLFLVSCKNFLLSNTLTLISRSKSIHSLLLQILTVVSGDHWSSWSGWSKCSRTCDGGASYQLRKCLKSYIFRTDCHGDRIRYQTCNNDVSVGSSASLFTPFSAFVVKNR